MSTCPKRTLVNVVLLSLLIILYFATNYQQIYALAKIYHHRLQGLSHSSFSTNRGVFIEQWLNTQVGDPFNISAISELCMKRRPRNDVVVRCAPGTGGVGNIRSYMLHCIRFAMESGGSMIVPRFHGRAPDDLANMHGELQDFDFFFDRPWFKRALEEACPYMTVYDFQSPEWVEVGGIPHFGGGINESTIDAPSPWRQEFDSWLTEASAGKSKPWVVKSSDPGREKAVMDDGLSLYRHFGRLLQFRPDVRRLAAVATAEMSARFGLHIDPSHEFFEQAYLGAHVRTSSDAVKAGWNPDFEQQTDNYLQEAKEAGLAVIYAAGGNEEDLEQFVIKARDEGLTVMTKSDLLSGNDLRELDNLSWDQKGLLDFEIMLRATKFGGYARSSWGINIAFRRHFLSVLKDPFSDPHDFFADEFSRVFGRYDPGWEAETIRTMWP